MDGVGQCRFSGPYFLSIRIVKQDLQSWPVRVSHVNTEDGSIPFRINNQVGC